MIYAKAKPQSFPILIMDGDKRTICPKRARYPNAEHQSQAEGSHLKTNGMARFCDIFPALSEGGKFSPRTDTGDWTQGG